MSDIDLAKASILQAIDDLSRSNYVSRETLSDLELYHDAIVKWNRKINIISPSDIPVLWRRHILDCFHLRQFRPLVKHWIDLGSGAGLPGIVLAISLKGLTGAEVHLVEANGKKVAFLNTMRRELALPLSIHHTRVEDILLAGSTLSYTLTARALAPLPQLMNYACQLARNHTIVEAVWMKGKNWQDELLGQKVYQLSKFAENHNSNHLSNLRFVTTTF